MLKKRSKYDHVKARSQWMSHSPNADPSTIGKKRFPVHKNKNSSQFQQVIYQDPAMSPVRRSLPSLAGSPHQLQGKEKTKEAEVQVETDQISRLEQQLKDKETQLTIMQNMFNHTASRARQSKARIDYEYIRRNKKDSIVEEASPASVNRDSSLIVRNSSLPSIRTNRHADFVHHSAFVQPKFTRSRPKIILTNPITGVIPYY